MNRLHPLLFGAFLLASANVAGLAHAQTQPLEFQIEPLLRLAERLPALVRSGGWDTRFSFPTLIGDQTALLVDGDDLYVGGDFEDAAGNDDADALARWDGRQWHPVGPGFTGDPPSVLALAGSGNALYVGGRFGVDGEDVRDVGLWDGSEWHALGTGLYCPRGGCEVRALALDGDDLYVGGSFFDAGGVDGADRIARWDGSQWHALRNGLNDEVRSIAVANGNVYVAGDFTDAGGDGDADYVAMWDGEAWHALGFQLLRGRIRSGSLLDPVFSVVAAGDDVYVGGAFTDAGGDPDADYVARWDGEEWHAVGEGLEDDVHTLVIDGDATYAGGEMGTMRWDGGEWIPLEGVEHAPLALARMGETLVAGVEERDGGPLLWRDGRWRWFSDGLLVGQTVEGFPLSAQALLLDEDGVYVGGVFLREDVDNIGNLARWNGDAWEDVGDTVPGIVLTLARFDDLLVAGGAFTGGSGGVGIQVQEGQDAWTPLTDGPAGLVSALLVVDGSLYAAGDFTDVAGNPDADYIAHWDGSVWQPVGGGLTGPLHAVAVHEGSVFVGGDFTGAGPNGNADYVAYWDGTAWMPVGVGLNGLVTNLISHGGTLYAAGAFADAGGDPDADAIARWNGAAWESVGSGPNGVVMDLSAAGDVLVAAGLFLNEDSTSASVATAWDGERWTPLDAFLFKKLPGLDPAPAFIWDTAAAGDKLYFSGDFTNAFDGTQVSGFGIYTGLPFGGGTVATEDPEVRLPVDLAVYPNPAAGAATIALALDRREPVRISIYDLLGREIAILHDGPIHSGRMTWTWKPDDIASGAYLVRVAGESFETVRGVVVVR